MRIVFAGTPAFAAVILAALIERRYDVIAVYTQPDRPAGRGRQLAASDVKQLALQHAIPVVQPVSLRDPGAAAQLRELQPDVLVVAAYGLILPQAVLDVAPCVNVHASLLPRWRGAAPIQRAILAGDDDTGITIMRMRATLDTGPMLATGASRIETHDTAGSLQQRLAALGAKLLIETLDRLATDSGLDIEKIAAVEQDDAQATYAAKIAKAEAELDWNEAAQLLARKIRAFNPAPIATALLGAERLRIWSAEALAMSGDRPPGTIVASSAAGIDIATGDGVLRITRLQQSGRRAVSAADYVNAQRRQSGA